LFIEPVLKRRNLLRCKLVYDVFREGILNVRGVVLVAWPGVGQHLLKVDMTRSATEYNHKGILTQALLQYYSVVGMGISLE
jgi:hypothetical protein